MSVYKAQEIVIKTPHISMAAKRWGTEEGFPVLGLHGWLDNANTFDRLAPLLPQLDLVSLDLPGHGKSDHRPVGVRYHYTDYVDDVIAAANALKWKKFTLLGHSMGAGITTFVASAFPDRITRVILIEGLGALTGDVGLVPDLLRKSVEAMQPQASKKTTAYKDIEVLVRARAAAGRIDRESVKILLQRGLIIEGGSYYWRSDQRLRRSYPQYFTNEVILAFLKNISSPVLLITAEDGILKKRDYFSSRIKALKNLQHSQLPGYHHLHLDNPKPVAEVINRFLHIDS